MDNKTNLSGLFLNPNLTLEGGGGLNSLILHCIHKKITPLCDVNFIQNNTKLIPPQTLGLQKKFSKNKSVILSMGLLYAPPLKNMLV